MLNIWPNGLCVYDFTRHQCSKNFVQTLQTAFEHGKFISQPIAAARAQALGFQAVVEDEHLFMVDNTLVLNVHIQTKKVPVSVLRRACRTAEAEHTEQQCRVPNKTERQNIKDAVHARLLEKAFVEEVNLPLFVDFTHQRIYVGTSAVGTAEMLLGLLRKAVGGLPVIPLSAEKSVALSMSDWLVDPMTLRHFELGEKATLEDDNDSKYNVKDEDIHSPEVQLALERGKVATRIALLHQHAGFTLNKDLLITNLRWASEYKDLNGEADLGTDSEIQSARVFLMINGVRDFLKWLALDLGGFNPAMEKPQMAENA